MSKEKTSVQANHIHQQHTPTHETRPPTKCKLLPSIFHKLSIAHHRTRLFVSLLFRSNMPYCNTHTHNHLQTLDPTTITLLFRSNKPRWQKASLQHPQPPTTSAPRITRVGQNRIYIYTVYDRTFGDFPAKNTVQHAPGPSQPCCAGKLEAVHLHPQPPTTTQVPHLVLHNHTVQGSWKQCTYTHNHPQPPTARTWSFTTIMRRVA